MDSLNELLGVDRINVDNDASGQLVCSYRRRGNNPDDFTENEIFKLMEYAGNMGLTQRELQGELTKQLKALDQEIIVGKRLQKVLDKMDKDGRIKCIKGE